MRTVPVNFRNICRGMLLSVGLVACAFASGAEPVVKKFELPAQDAAVAVASFARQAGVQLLISEADARDRRTNAIRGSYPIAEALRLLLSGTGLVAEETAPQTYTIVHAPKSSRNGAGAPAVQNTLQIAQVEPEKKSTASPPAVNDPDVQEIQVRAAKDTGIVNQGVIPREANQALRYQIWDRTAIEDSGAVDLPEFFRQVTASTNAGTGTQATFGRAANIPGGVGEISDTIDLRGFGSAQTLVMLNGRRLYGSETSGPDISRIPLSAVERIELLPTSGSAIYGSQAVGGVVNIVLRKDYGGTQLSSSFGTSTGGGASEYKLDLYHAQTMRDGATNLTYTLSYDQREALHGSQRGYYERALDIYTGPTVPGFISFASTFTGSRAYVTNAFGSALGIPGSTATFAAVPVGSNGVLTPSSFVSTAGTVAASLDRPSQRMLLPPSEGFSLYSTLEHAIGDNGLSLYADVNFGYRTRDTDYPGFNGNVIVGPTNPLNPFRTGVTTGFVGRTLQVAFNPADLPVDHVKSISRTYRAVAGIQGAFLEQRWKWALDLSWSREQTNSRNVSWLPLISAAVNAGLYNPFRDTSTIGMASQAQMDSLYAEHELEVVPTMSAANWRINGDTFRTWGGTAKLSIGAEARSERYVNDSAWNYGSYASLPNVQVQTPDRTSTTRRASAAYAEMVLPLVGERNRRPMLYSLDLSGAIRYEKYDDFGSASPPMVALKYAPAENFALRGSYSEGFQPPTQNDLYQETLLIVQPINIARFIFTDRRRQGFTPLYPPGTQFTTQNQGNADLLPETSENIDAGFIFTPRWAPNFTLNVGYFRYDKRDVVTFLSGQQLFDNYPELFIRGPNLPTDPAGVPGPVQRYINMPINVSRLFVDGVDFDASYMLPTSRMGVFTFTVNGTRNFRFREQVLPGEPIIEIVGEVDILPSLSAPLKMRNNASVRWEGDRWSAGVSSHYTHGYHTNETTPTEGNSFASGIDGNLIESALTYDARIGYDIPRDGTGAGSAQWLEGTKFSLSVINLLDTAPPYTSNSQRSWYSFYQDPRQRFISLQIRKDF